MKISKKTYDRLTLPWRCIDNWPLFQRADPPNYHWVTNCKIVWLILGYPIAWPLLIGACLVLWALAIMVVLCIPIIFPMVWIGERIGIQWDQCKRVEWTPEDQ